MYNKAIKFYEKYKTKIDLENLALLIEQYKYGHFNTDFDKEFNNYVRRFYECKTNA